MKYHFGTIMQVVLLLLTHFFIFLKWGGPLQPRACPFMNTSFAKPLFSSFFRVGVRLNCSPPGIPGLTSADSQAILVLTTSDQTQHPLYYAVRSYRTALGTFLSPLRYVFEFVISNGVSAICGVRSVASILLPFPSPFPVQSNSPSAFSAPLPYYLLLRKSSAVPTQAGNEAHFPDSS